MNNNKGFTLLEIISVVTIIVILSVIIVPIVDKNIKEAQKVTISSQIKTIENAAYIYAINYRNEIPELDTNKVATIDIATLLDKGLLEEKSISSIYSGGIGESDFVIIAIVDNTIKTIFDIDQSTNPYILVHGPSKLTMELGTSYNELGAVVINFLSGVVTELDSAYIDESDVNNVTPGTYTVTYSYSNYRPAERIVVVASNSTQVDNEKPLITITPPETMTISKGNNYTDPGYSASDTIDGDITSRMVITGTVNTKQKGTYYLKYDVTDLAGNKAVTVIRTVIVN